MLLIVPYGIETKFLELNMRQGYSLLIVPYGIETDLGMSRIALSRLLIVPYGIETRSFQEMKRRG